jgi:stage IV sporulation protein FB
MFGRPGDSLYQVFALMNWSFPVGRYLGVQVRIHIWFVIFVLFEVLAGFESYRIPMTARSLGLLFLAVLLHEFGHCFACRAVGGTANEVLLWPLGGLAYCDAPRRPWSEFATAAGGPLVNIVLAAACFAMLAFRVGTVSPLTFNPLAFRFAWAYQPGWVGVVADFYSVNLTLLVFNLLLVFHPFDGGRLIQTALWGALGYVRSLRIASVVGMVGAVACAVYATFLWNWMLLFFAIYGFGTSYQQRVQAQGADGFEEPEDYRTSAQMPRRRRRTWLGSLRERFRVRRRQRLLRLEDELDNEVYRILDKVRTQGLHSLSRQEKKTLQRATERQRTDG